MFLDFFLKGLLIGITVAAPVGPIGVLCIKKTLTEGRLAGFFTGLGAAFADSIYGAVAGFGLSGITNFLIAYEFWLKLAGGLFLFYLGIKIFISKPSVKEAEVKSKGYLRNFFSTFFLTVTNPATIFSFLAIFTSLGLAQSGNENFSAWALVVGVFIGSAVWWFTLTSITGYFRNALNNAALTWVNRCSGILILTFACWSLITALL